MPDKRRALLCPNCRKLISSDEARCPHCGASQPNARWKHMGVFRWFQDPAQLVWAVIFLNIGMYVISLFLNLRLPRMSLNPLTALAPDNESLILLGATGSIPINQLHRWWTLVSANYLHGGLLHIFFNMMAFRQVAPLVIREFGPYRLIVIYTLSGVLGFYISYMAGVTFTIGASAAICGLIGTLLFYGWNRGGPYGQMIFRQVGGWVITLFIFGFLVPGINNWGHGGGLAAGALLGFLLGYNERVRENNLHRAGALCCIIVTLLVLIWALLTSVLYRFGA